MLAVRWSRWSLIMLASFVDYFDEDELSAHLITSFSFLINRHVEKAENIESNNIPVALTREVRK